MSGIILTGYDDLPYGHIGERSWSRYASIHWHDFHCRRAYDQKSHPSWQKLDLILEFLEMYDWVFWTDVDSVCTNTKREISEFWPGDGQWLSVSRDWSAGGRWSAGHMLVLPGAIAFLEKAKTVTRWKNHALWDQSAMHAISDDYVDHINVLGRRELNAVPADVQRSSEEPWEPGDFLAHITGIPQESRLAFMEKYEKEML